MRRKLGLAGCVVAALAVNAFAVVEPVATLHHAAGVFSLAAV